MTERPWGMEVGPPPGRGHGPRRGAMGRHVRLAPLVLAALMVVAQPGRTEALSTPPYPVIFVHGLASGAATWTGMAQFLVAQGWQFGGAPTFVPATLGVTTVSTGHFYAMSFSDYDTGAFPSQNLSLDRQGYELAAVIQEVLSANPGAHKVILVAHSMGGLAARAYLQGLARLDPFAARIPYRGDVARLIAIGTPHLGSPLASLCQSLPSACLEASIDPASTAVAELVYGSPALSALNDLDVSPLPLDVAYESIAGLGGTGLVSDGDGFVPKQSQEFLAAVSGLTHRLRELAVPDRSDCGTAVVGASTVVFAEVHTCEPGDAGVLGAALDAVLQPRLALSLNTKSVSIGDTLTLTLEVQSGFPDQENIGDFYIGALVPDGSIYLLTPTGFVLAFAAGVVVPDGVQAFRSNTVLASGAETIFSAPISTPIPAGDYTLVAVVVKAGTTPGDANNWLSNLAQVSFVLAPPAGSSPFSDMPGNTWRRASPAGRTVYQSAVHATDPTQPDACGRTITSPNPVTRTYSGLAAGGGKVFNWGGGHSSHPGNDVDLYDPMVNVWAVQLPPECPVNGSSIAQAIAGTGGAVTTVTPAGRPYTQHSYRQCAFDPVRDRFLCVVASGTWSYDVVSTTWTRLASPSASPQWFLGYGSVVYEGVADRLIAFVTSPFGSTARGVHVFNPATNVWTFRGVFPLTFADVTPVAAYMRDTQETAIHFGGFGLWRYALTTGTWQQVTSVPNVVKSVEANFDYDTLNRRVVFLITPLAGVRSTAVWAWDPAADSWQAMPAPPVVPTPFLYASGSERGHFVYEAKANVFVYVESVTLYCTLGGAWACGGLTDTWVYRYGAPASTAAFSIPLTVTEPGAGASAPAAIPRSRDTVTGGVPVPASLLDGPWALMDGAVEVPVQLTRLKGSWLLVDFQTDLAGWGSKTFSLVPFAPAASAPSPVTVSEDTTGATISTGPLTVSVHRDLSPFSLQYVDHAGTVFAAQAPTVWSWEISGPIRSTLRVDGVFASGLAYTLRLTFRAGHNDVTAQVVLRNSRVTGYRSEKVLSATIAYGSGATVWSGGFGTMTYVPCAPGCAFELLPAFVYADTATNGGVVIPDMSHWGADARLDFDGGLSADEATRRARSAIYPLVPLASAETYATAGLTAEFSTLQDERDANTKWGWTWTASQEPTVPHRAYPGVTWLYVDVHGDTEADDTWQNVVMYLRTGQRGYWDRARSWARYVAWQYTHRTDGWTYGTARPKGAEPSLTAADQAYLLTLADGRLDIDDWLADHFYGWGMLDWYLLSGDPVALEAASDLLQESQKQWGSLPGYTFVYGLRNIARHLLFTVRHVEVTGDAMARAHADHLAMLLLTTASWDESWGMYLWPNSSSARPKAVSPFHIAILHHAMERYWMLTGNAEVQRRMLKMSDFAMAHGLHPTFQVGVYEVAVDSPAAGQVWYGGFTATTPVNPYYSAVWIDMLVRAWAMTADQKYLDRAVLHWEKASKITYGSLYNQPNAGPTQVGRYTGFLNQRLGTCCSAPDSIYFELNGFLPYAHRLHRGVVRPAGS